MSRARLFCAVALPCAIACRSEAIEWEPATPLASEPGSWAEWAFDDSARLVRVPAPPPESPAVVLPSARGQCEATVRLVSDRRDGDWYAAWWQTRSDGTADLLAAYSPDGVTWSAPVRVDTTDVARSGCAKRLPPGVFADGGIFHLAYSMAAREGPGIFASHSMDRGRLFHSPVAVVYGERIGHADVAARGPVVAVAYEDPNTEPRRISLAFSRTMGHLFQSRMTVSPPTSSENARAPGVILGSRSIAVTWTVGRDSTRRVVRIGRFRGEP